MNKRFGIAAVFALMSFSGYAQQTGIVKLRGTRLTYPLVNRWITEFKKDHPNIQVSIAQSARADSIDFTIASYALTPNDLQGNREGVAVTRYAQLLIANSKRPGLAELQAKGVTERDLNKLFFTNDKPTFLTPSQSATPIDLYVRDRPVCAVKAFSKHYGVDPKELKGTGIKGDDQDLATAVRNDVNGISFNNLGFIYDVGSRKITDGLAVIPQDLNNNGKVDDDEQIYETLDHVISVIEKTNNAAFIVERVNFVFNKTSANAAAGIFLNWVLSKGQQFNHALGFLSMSETMVREQKALTNATFKVASAPACDGATDIMSQRKTKLASK
jgi:phosphate transport system substrate-binding protein